MRPPLRGFPLLPSYPEYEAFEDDVIHWHLDHPSSSVLLCPYSSVRAGQKPFEELLHSDLNVPLEEIHKVDLLIVVSKDRKRVRVLKSRFGPIGKFIYIGA